MSSPEQMVEALKFMAEQITILTQNSLNKDDRAKSKNWDEIGRYKNVKVFGGDPKEWEEFWTKFKSQVSAGSPKVAEMLDEVEAKLSELELEEEGFEEKLTDFPLDEDEVREIGHMLHNLLLSLTTGEANAVVRRCRGRHGLLAWKRLCTTLNPRTLASGVKAISQALNPPKIANSTKADMNIEAWEDKMAKLSTEYGEKLSAKMKVAVLYAMLPKDLQEKVLDKCAVNWDSVKDDDAAAIYGRVKEEMKNIAKSRRDMVTPKPMEVDHVQTDWSWWSCDGYEEEQVHDEGEQEEALQGINYVGKGKGKGKGLCWTCGEPGHRAAECPKAGKGGGKGSNYYYKGGYKGDGKNSKGGYKGGKGESKAGKGTWYNPMPRACFVCGSTTHLARDCPNAKTTQEVQVVRSETGDLEVLFIAHTTAEDDAGDWEEVKKKIPRQRSPGGFIPGPPGLMGKTKRGESGGEVKGFKVLEMDETDEDEEDEVPSPPLPQPTQVECTACPPGARCRSRVSPKSRRTREPEESDVRMVNDYTGGQKPAGVQKTWASLGTGEIIVDSAADESCWPKDLGGAFETRPSTRNIQLRTANGGVMNHYGEKSVTFCSGNDEGVVGLKFQVTDVKKPLLAVRRLVERGNVVSFGPTPDDNFIKNVETGKVIPLEKKGGSFILKAHFMKEIDTKEPEPVFSRQAR